MRVTAYWAGASHKTPIHTLGHFQSLEQHAKDTDWLAMHDFLLMFYSDLMSTKLLNSADHNPSLGRTRTRRKTMPGSSKKTNMNPTTAASHMTRSPLPIHQISMMRQTDRQTDTDTDTHTHTQPFNSRWSRTTRVGRYQKKLTHSHPSWSSDILYQLPPFTIIYSNLCSVYVLDNPLWQPLSRSSLVFLLVLDPLLHTPYISSPSHYLLFAAHPHTNTPCSAVIPMLCHLHLVSFSVPYLGICLLA